MPALAHLDKIWLSEIARLLPELLTQQSTLPPPGPFTEYWQSQRFFEALARGFLAGQAPLLLLIDDLQWCDQETLEWLHFLLRFAPKAKLLVLGTARSEELNANAPLLTLVRALQRVNQLHEFTLAPLDAAEVAKLAITIGERELVVAEPCTSFARVKAISSLSSNWCAPGRRWKIRSRPTGVPLPQPLSVRTHQQPCHLTSTLSSLVA
jgi:hypothetical protein